MITEDIGTYLASVGIGTVGATIFYGYYPHTPNDLVSLYQSAGTPPEVVNTSPRIEYPELHVVCRGSGDTAYSIAMEKAQDVMVALHAIGERTLSGTRYLYIRALGSPALLRYDYSNKPPLAYCVIHFQVVKEVDP